LTDFTAGYQRPRPSQAGVKAWAPLSACENR
jgi:hypothetical protein